MKTTACAPEAFPSHGRGPRFDPVSAHHPSEAIREENQGSPNVVPFRPRVPDSAPIGTERHHNGWTARGQGSRIVLDKAQLPEGATYVYYIRVADFIKIGISRRWKRRINNISTASPFEVQVLLVEIESPALEKRLHRKFKHLRHRGEWFRAEPNLLAYIANKVANHHDVSLSVVMEAW